MKTTIALRTRAAKISLFACLLTAMLIAPPSSKSAAAQGIAFNSVSGDGANIFSPTYIVPKGLFLDTLTYHHYDETADVYDSQGAKKNSIDITSQAVNESIAYGITDSFDVQVGMGDYPQYRTKTTAVMGNTTSTNASGVTDPTIAAAYRLLFQNHRHPMNWDIEAAYSPNTFDKKSASLSQDGTVARGSDSESISTAISRTVGKLSVGLSTGATYDGRARNESLSTGDVVDSNPYWSYEAALNTQTVLTGKLSLGANVAYTFYNSRDSQNTLTNAALVQGARTEGDYELSLNYQAIPNTLAFALTYDYDTYSNRSDNYALTPNNDTTTENDHANEYGAVLQFAF